MRNVKRVLAVGMAAGLALGGQGTLAVDNGRGCAELAASLTAVIHAAPPGAFGQIVGKIINDNPGDMAYVVWALQTGNTAALLAMPGTEQFLNDNPELKALLESGACTGRG